jgi:hypothetical protein
MAINTGRGWVRSKDYKSLSNDTKKIKCDGSTITDGDMLTIQENGVGLETLELLGCTFSGENPEFDDLPGIAAAATITDIDLTGSTGLSGAPAIGWQVCENLVNVSINDCGYDADAVDAFLIAMAAAVAGTPGLASGGTPGVINVAGASNGIRTAASDAANTALGSAGFTVTQNA